MRLRFWNRGRWRCFLLHIILEVEEILSNFLEERISKGVVVFLVWQYLAKKEIPGEVGVSLEEAAGGRFSVKSLEKKPVPVGPSAMARGVSGTNALGLGWWPDSG